VIDPEILKAGGHTGHWGLLGIRERANRFGGKLAFWSEAGAAARLGLKRTTLQSRMRKYNMARQFC
jgi:signal transduction histidine kinase